MLSAFSLGVTAPPFPPSKHPSSRDTPPKPGHGRRWYGQMGSVEKGDPSCRFGVVEND
jgi:hypothetical protein